MVNQDDVPSFGTGDTPMDASTAAGNGAEANGAAEAFEAEDELSFSASVDKVQEVTEQLAEFLVRFSPAEQRLILGPFLGPPSDGSIPVEDDEQAQLNEPHIDEARRFIWNYLNIYSECERDLILEKWRPALDTASLSSATESLTPSVTPPGSVTPTAITPREFLSARRELNEKYHSHSPSMGDFERP